MKIPSPSIRSFTKTAKASFLALCGSALLISLTASASGEVKKPITIMPLGDSITEIPVSYRYPLMKRLQSEGYAVKYVGRKTSYANPAYPEMGKLAHEGHGGKTVQFLAEEIKDSYLKHPADIILIHAGHNQFADQKPIPGIIAATREIIGSIRNINPKATILLGQVITAGKLPKYSYIPELNVELGKLATELDRPNQRVIAVNHAEGFNWEIDTVEDKVHPNVAGGEKMANKWYETLLTILPSPEKP